MVRRRNSQVMKKHSRCSTSKIDERSSSTTSMAQQNFSEHLDDETKLAKRHLTKEMWQLVSIAVKRMADEFVSISNNQHTATRTTAPEMLTTTMTSNNTPIKSTETVNTIQQTSSLPVSQQLTTTDVGAGDVPTIKRKPMAIKEPIKKRTLPIQMLDLSVHTKRKSISNNAKNRSLKPKVQDASSKRNGKKLTLCSRTNRKLK